MYTFRIITYYYVLKIDIYLPRQAYNDYVLGAVQLL